MYNFRLLTRASSTRFREQGSAAVQLLSRSVLLVAVLVVLGACGEGGSGNSATPKPYTVGTKARFGTGGNGAAFLTSGWSSPEAGHTWSDKLSAVVTLGMEPSTEPLLLRMQLRGLSKAPELPSQPVEVLANGTKIADWEVADEAEHTAEIPAELVRAGGALNIELKIPKATTPKQLGLGNDERVLGVSLQTLQIDRAAH
jgi:hypothetical protein